MTLTLKNNAVSLFILIFANNIINCEIIFEKDTPYDDIQIKIPQAIWKQALDQAPILRSPVTIVLPIHVQQNDENEIVDDPEEPDTEDVIVDATLVQDAPVNEVNVEPVSASPVSIQPPAAVTNVTQTIVQNDESTVEPVEEVTGQVTRFPCSCVSGQCGCCTGAILQRFSMKACGNISFIPEDFVFDVRMSVNNNTVVRRRVSASDPPPICFNPRRAPFVRVCAEISNIRIRNRNAFACLDIEADIGGFTVYTASFRCFSLGSKGVQTGLKPKPVSSGPKPVSLFGSGNNEDEGGFLENAAGAVFGGDGDGLFGGGDGGGIFGGGDGLFGGGGGDDGPLDGIGDAIGDFFEGRGLD